METVKAIEKWYPDGDKKELACELIVALNDYHKGDYKKLQILFSNDYGDRTSYLEERIENYFSGLLFKERLFMIDVLEEATKCWEYQNKTILSLIEISMYLQTDNVIEYLEWYRNFRMIDGFQTETNKVFALNILNRVNSLPNTDRVYNFIHNIYKNVNFDMVFAAQILFGESRYDVRNLPVLLIKFWQREWCEQDDRFFELFIKSLLELLDFDKLIDVVGELPMWFVKKLFQSKFISVETDEVGDLLIRNLLTDEEVLKHQDWIGYATVLDWRK